METRKIKYIDEWKSIGDEIILKEKISFLFWNLPFKIKRIYKIFFIGKDGGATVFRKNSKLSLDTPEKIDYAYCRGHLKYISGNVEINHNT